MSNPNKSGERAELRKLLDRMAAVHPKCMSDVFVQGWLNGDPAARRKIEEVLDRLPKKNKAN